MSESISSMLPRGHDKSVTDNIGLYTYGAAAAAFLLLTVLLVAQWRVRPLGFALAAASAVTALWAGVVALGTLVTYPPIILMQFAELARAAAWFFFLLQLLGFRESGDVWRWMGRPWLPFYAAIIAAAAAVLLLRPAAGILGLGVAFTADAALGLWVVMATAGLVLVEQVYRNATDIERWGVKFLCLALGAGFAYDFYLYAEALLFRQLNPQLWQARGLVVAALVPWLMIAIARNRSWRMNLYVSRYVVFHTVTLLGAGLYLLCMALVGYFIRYLGGSWGGVLQIGFFAGAGALLASLLFSANLRARLRVTLSKHFFSYRYDYREEWLRFTDGLGSAGRDTGQKIIRLMADVTSSRAGLLVQRGTDGGLNSITAWEMTAPRVPSLDALAEWIVRRNWVIDLQEYAEAPERYGDLVLPDWLAKHDTLWLVVPLFFQRELEAVLFLTRSDVKARVNWEDRDLLKTAGRQAAALLAQQRASTALVEARQFDAFNRLSAYVIHDLKNILAQQSLMVANARKHRDNPAFIDDMISTVENSVRRMQRLMDQMRSGMRDPDTRCIALESVLDEVVAVRARTLPKPTVQARVPARVMADRERLSTVFGHLIQNAQEATRDDGEVQVTMTHADGWIEVIIRDTGSGMSEDFVRERLFRPFESTKGLTGMGIGAFESREYVRQLGGDITVSSTLGAGSVFTVRLPVVEEGEAVDILPSQDTAPDQRECDADTPSDTPAVANSSRMIN